MDNRDPLSARWLRARSEIARLADPLSVGTATSDALRAYIARVTRGLGEVQVDDLLIHDALHITLLSQSYPVSAGYQPEMDDWYQRLDDLAGAIDIYSRVDRDRQTTLSRLAAHLYLLALQPSKAARVAAPLRDAVAQPSVAQAVTQALGNLLAMRGDRSTAQAFDSLRAAIRVEFEEDVAADVDPVDRLRQLALEAGRGDLLSLALECELAVRSRQTYSLLNSSAATRLSDSYLRQCISSAVRIQRTQLFPVQRWAIDNGLLDAPVVSVATPTGSGKTFMAELRIAASVNQSPGGLAVYVAPYNALANQVRSVLEERLGRSGSIITLWTGAYELDNSIDSLGDVLVTTPEKLDFILRGQMEDDDRSEELLQRATTLIFDEANMIANGSRGLRYEFLLQRVRRRLPSATVMTMSAVQQDPTAFAQWIAGPGDGALGIPLQWASARGVDLLWQKDGSLVARGDPDPVADMPRPAKAQTAAAQLAAELLRSLPSVLLIDTRKDWVEALAGHLYREYKAVLERRLGLKEASDPDVRQQLERVSESVRWHVHPTYPLAEFLRVGLAFHHAGLPPTIRREIERLARDERIHTLVSTTTLAEGADLPFRAVIMVHLNFPGEPVPAATLRNIRGRAGRPFYSNEGYFFVLEPEKTDTRSFQYFLDHYWEPTVERREAESAVRDLLQIGEGGEEMRRVLESQLLAYIAEEDFDLAKVPTLASRTYLAARLGADNMVVRQVASVIERRTAQMTQEPPLVTNDGVLSLTGFGRGVALGGLSATSGRFVRDVLTAHEGEVEDLLDARGAAWVAVRCAWLPWEAVEKSSEYSQRRFRPQGAAPFVRNPATLNQFEDGRLRPEYGLADALLRPSEYTVIAHAEPALSLVRGRTSNDRIANVVEWALGHGQLLAWTLTGVVRVAQHLGEDSTAMSRLAAELLPFIKYLPYWMPSDIGVSLTREVMDRESCLRLLAAGDLWQGSVADLWRFVSDGTTNITALIGVDATNQLVEWVKQRMELEV